MRKFSIAFSLLLAGCATAPQQPQPVPVPVPVPQAVVPDRAGLVGLTAAQVIAKLGSPALQVREGTSLKLQFRNSRCVLDAYLYPERSRGQSLVEHVDTRAPSGVDANEEVCVTLFQSKDN